MVTSAILRIIEGTQNKNPDKVWAYAQLIIPEDEYEFAHKAIYERFNPNAAYAVMDDSKYETKSL